MPIFAYYFFCVRKVPSTWRAWGCALMPYFAKPHFSASIDIWASKVNGIRETFDLFAQTSMSIGLYR